MYTHLHTCMHTHTHASPRRFWWAQLCDCDTAALDCQSDGLCGGQGPRMVHRHVSGGDMASALSGHMSPSLLHPTCPRASCTLHEGAWPLVNPGRQMRIFPLNTGMPWRGACTHFVHKHELTYTCAHPVMNTGACNAHVADVFVCLWPVAWQFLMMGNSVEGWWPVP